MKIFSYFKKILFIFLFTIIFFFLLDFFFGKQLITFFKIDKSTYFQKKHRIKHEFFHHTLASNINSELTIWGNDTYTLCTNENGFKIKCGEKNNSKRYNVAFIGDSFTEGVGLNHEDTFVGLFEKHKKIKAANLGVQGYSTKIYLSKIKFFIEKGVKFDHLIIFLDLSDLYEDTNLYKLKNNFKVVDKKINKRIENFFSINFTLTSYYVWLLRHEFNFKKLLSLPREIKEITSTKVIKEEEIKKNINLQTYGDYSYRNNVRSMWTFDKSYSEKFDKSIEEAIKDQVAILNEIYKILKLENTKMSIALYPWPQNIFMNDKNNFYIDEIKKFCKHKCENFINFFDLFFSQKIDRNSIVKKYYLDSDVHFNKHGHKKIADHLIKNYYFK